MGTDVGSGSSPSGMAGPGTRVAPLRPILTLTFINSLGTGVVTNGIFFLAASAYGLGAAANFALGIVLGITYITGAKAVGPLLAWLRRSPRHSTRNALALILTLCGLLCFVPYAAETLNIGGAWPAWLLVAAYSPLTGCLWPIVEAYLSGGRREESLRRSLGVFNTTWSASLVLAFWAIGPLVEGRPLEVIAGLGVLHVASVGLVAFLPREPAAHAHDEGHAHPASYERLLDAHRLLLPLTYLIVSAMAPYLPTAMATLGIEMAWQTPLAATWLLTRVAGFVWMQHDHRWHGKWAAPALATVAILAGFGLVMLSPRIGEGAGREIGVAVLATGLGVLGIGVAAIYTGALYYAMEVGGADVDAGGTHEALIGVGYTLGPGLGLAAFAAEAEGLLAKGLFEPLVVGMMGTLAIGVWIWTMSRTRRAA